MFLDMLTPNTTPPFVTFDDASHTYTRIADGVIVPSVSEIMRVCD